MDALETYLIGWELGVASDICLVKTPFLTKELLGPTLNTRRCKPGLESPTLDTSFSGSSWKDNGTSDIGNDGDNDDDVVMTEGEVVIQEVEEVEDDDEEEEEEEDEE